MALYPSITHEARLKALKDALDNKESKSISTEDLIKTAHLYYKIIILNLMG